MTKVSRARILPSLVEQIIQRGHVLYHPGDVVDRVFFPVNAVMSVVTLMQNGQAVESSTVGYESAVPLFSALAGTPATSRIFAQIGGTGSFLPSRILRDCAAEDFQLTRLLWRHAGATAFQSEQGAACNAVHEGSARLARWILMTQDRVGESKVPLTQDYMAVMTGVQRTTISGFASQLKSEGLIKYARGNLEIINRAGLEDRACECYGVIKSEFASLLQSDGDDATNP